MKNHHTIIAVLILIVAVPVALALAGCSLSDSVGLTTPTIDESGAVVSRDFNAEGAQAAVSGAQSAVSALPVPSPWKEILIGALGLTSTGLGVVAAVQKKKNTALAKTNVSTVKKIVEAVATPETLSSIAADATKIAKAVQDQYHTRSEVAKAVDTLDANISPTVKC